MHLSRSQSRIRTRFHLRSRGAATIRQRNDVDDNDNDDDLNTHGHRTLLYVRARTLVLWFFCPYRRPSRTVSNCRLKTSNCSSVSPRPRLRCVASVTSADASAAVAPCVCAYVWRACVRSTAGKHQRPTGTRRRCKPA